MKKKAMIMSMWDLKTFFDTENVIDCMNELYKSQVKGKTYRLLYKMNENLMISVKTDSSLGQGSIKGPIGSAVSLDNGVGEEFNDEDETENDNKEEKPETLNSLPKDFFHPCLYQDDIAKASLNVESAQVANDKIEHVVESKLLTLNLEKTTFVVLGNERARNKILERIGVTTAAIFDR